MEGDYYKTKESVEEYISMAKDVNGQGIINKLKNFLPAGKLMLEIGSGPGSDFNILKQDYELVGSDFSDEFLKHLIKNNPEDEFLNLNAITLDIDRKFDAIYSNKVFQHLNDREIEESVIRQADILNARGIICLSFWKGEGEEIFHGMLVNYQNKQSLKKLFGELFEILLIEEYDEFEKDDSILLIARKK